jgi:shikimate dehydrogenase
MNGGEIMKTTDLYAVIGNPIAHSKSPLIHAAFARDYHQDISYERILAPLDKFRETVDAFRRRGARGANVTAPFKFEAFQYATKLTDRASASGAVNTLVFDGEEILGDNTDGIGLTRDITTNLGGKITDARVLLLGAGGAAFGVVGALLDQRPSILAIANRTHQKAVDLAAKYAGSNVRAIALHELLHEQFDLVINATSASLAHSPDDECAIVSPACFATDSLAYEMMYGKGETSFLQIAKRAGVRTADGVGMLAEQAAEAFFVWRGVRVETAGVIAMLSEGLHPRQSPGGPAYDGILPIN